VNETKDEIGLWRLEQECREVREDEGDCLKCEVNRKNTMVEKVTGLENRIMPKGPLSLVSTIEELLERESSGSGLENLYYGSKGSTTLTTRHSFIRKRWH
jgi:hypothetical protein